MVKIPRSVPQLRGALIAVPVTLLVIGALLGACSGDDNTSMPVPSNDAAPSDATTMASQPVADAASDAAEAGQTCDASIASVIDEAASGPYAACASCLERACSSELQQCFTSCSCEETAGSLFSCIGLGGAPQMCLTSIISGGGDSQQFTGFLGCAYLCGTLCLPSATADAGNGEAGNGDASSSDAGSDASSDAGKDAGKDGGKAADAGDAGDAGDASDGSIK